MNHLPGNLRILRKHKNLQQEDMLEKLGISRATWSNYELGKTEPNVETLISITEFFNVTMDNLVREDLSLDPEKLPYKARNYNKKSKKILQNEPGDNIVNDTHTPIAQEELLQEILNELRAIRKNLTQQ